MIVCVASSVSVAPNTDVHDAWIEKFKAVASCAGNQISSASASVDCEAHIFAQTYAFAAAKASAAAHCYGKSSDAKARTSVDAIVDALVYDKSKCTVKTKSKGLSINNVKSRTNTGSVRLLD